MNVSRKNKTITLILCILLGWLGIHRFYVGKTKSGILYLFTGGVLGFGWIYDIFEIIGNRFTDSKGASIATGAVSTKPTLTKWQFWVVLVLVWAIALGTRGKEQNEPIKDFDTDTSSLLIETKDTIQDTSSNISSNTSLVNSESKDLKVEIEVNGHREDTGIAFDIITNLPDTTELQLTLSSGDYNDKSNSITAQSTISIVNGKATSKTFLNNGSSLKGDFDLCVSMSLPSLQTDEVRKVIGENGENLEGDFIEKSTIGDSNVVNALFSVSVKDEITVKKEANYSYTVFKDDSTSGQEQVDESTASHEKQEVSSTPTIHEYVFIINTENNKVHKSSCHKGQEVLPEHRFELTVSAASEYEAVQYVLNQGYDPCGICMN